MNLTMLLEMAAAANGNRVAVQCGGDALRYDELLAASGAAARELVASGAAHLALLDVASLAAPAALFAAARAGVPYVPLNYRLTDDELAALLARIAPARLVTTLERTASFAGRPGASAIARDEFLAEARASAGEPPPAPDDADGIAVLLFTSGTTGAPKAAVLRHRHLVSYVLGSVEFATAGEEEAALVAVPPYHVAGTAAILSSVYAGRRIVQLPNFTPEAWLAAASAERVTHAFVVPTMLARIVDALATERAELPHLANLSYGGGKMPLPVIERALELLPNARFTNAYGLTETSSTIALLGPEDHRSAAASRDPALRRRLASAGRALPGVEIEVRDEEGKPLPPGSPGEVYVRGPQVSGEYVGRASLLGPDGWLATRDGGFLDAEGYLFLSGRVDDVIVRGGENLSPGEIEDVLLEHPGVAECAVVGVADLEWGEAVAAVIVLAPGASASAEDLRAWVHERLRSPRVPSRVVFRRVLPYNETGKLLRRVLRAELAGAEQHGCGSV